MRRTCGDRSLPRCQLCAEGKPREEKLAGGASLVAEGRTWPAGRVGAHSPGTRLPSGSLLLCPLSFPSQRLRLSGEQLSPDWKLWTLQIILPKRTNGKVNLVFTEDAKSLRGPCKAAMPIA